MIKKRNIIEKENRWAYTELEAEILADIVIVNEADKTDENGEDDESSEERFTEAVKHLNTSLKNTEAFQEYSDKVIRVSSLLSVALSGKIRSRDTL